ncbi:vitamin K epoxide reductase family protein [Chloroflexota bacterium]
MMVVGDSFLIGSYEIPQVFPEIIAKGLVSGGIDWPDIPGLAQLLEEETIPESNENNPKEDEVEENLDANKEETISSANSNHDDFREEIINQKEQSSIVNSDIGGSIVTTENMTISERFMQDRTGNSISTLVLFGMIFSVVFAGVIVLRPNHVLNQWPNWVISILLVIGLAVAIYLGYVEVTNSEAVCGPVGDCNTVQQSPYASLFGLIPIGLLGVLGYLVIGIVWLVSVFGEKKWRKISVFSLWGLAVFGMVFSISLTFLEPFVIGATCAWCLTSAVVMTLLFWNSTASLTQIGGMSQLKIIRQEQ